MKSRRQSSGGSSGGATATGVGNTHSSGGGCKLERKDVEKNRRLHMKGLCLKLSSLIPPAARRASLLSEAAASASNPNKIQNILAPNGSYPGQAWSSCKADIRNCSSTQIDVLHGFRKKLVSKLKVAEDKRNWGLFIDSCFTHCQTPSNISWHSPVSPRLDDRTIAEVVGDWYFGRRQDVKLIDCEYPCNPTCSSLLSTA